MTAAPQHPEAAGARESLAVSGHQPRVIGLDLSLTSTGVAGNGWTDRIKTKCRGHMRLDVIVDNILDFVRHADLVVVEGPSYGSTGSSYHELAGLWWLVTHNLWVHGIPFAVAAPGQVKRYATGKGNADKDVVIRQVARRFPWFEGGNDEADALILAAMGADQLGHPIAAMPETHRKALKSVEWPA